MGEAGRDKGQVGGDGGGGMYGRAEKGVMGGHGQREPDDVKAVGSPRMVVVHGRKARQITGERQPADCHRRVLRQAPRHPI